MALRSLDDKLMGEKVNNYCSSSEDEEEEKAPAPPQHIKQPRAKNGTGKGVVHTGPKGVIEDWRTYKRLEYEKREEEEKKRDEILKKLSLTCDPNAGEDGVDNEDKEFMDWYNKKRIMELKNKFASKWVGIAFGKVTNLTGENYVEEIESEKKFVTIIIHIYDDNVPACEAMNGCIQVLAQKYRTVKFCKVKASEARVSSNFVENGLPALLAYKNNVIIGNFVALSETLGEDFYATDVESFLHSYGTLPTSNESLSDD
uniref:Phosducin-like protein n=1 Tax=Ciona intestinalis TaxID=7719 RepID=F6PYG2_CIOIN|nr:phosducin-like protein [Ciona intestinalis]|eukprot:XP_009857665.1 phosducin-like protein [Ciona intestinalis]